MSCHSRGGWVNMREPCNFPHQSAPFWSPTLFFLSSLSLSLLAPLPLVNPNPFGKGDAVSMRMFYWWRASLQIWTFSFLCPLSSPTTCYSYLPVCWFTLQDSLSPTHPWRTLSRVQKVDGGCYHLSSPPWCEALSRIAEEWIPSETQSEEGRK